MCNQTGIAFAQRVLTADMIHGRDVLEVGALDVNGSIRPYVESFSPARYVGVDIARGPKVDEVVDASALVGRFGPASFDVVLTTEMLEHVRDWPTVIGNLKRVLRPGGVLLLTTRSIGYPYHGYPFDFWRYEPDDLRSIFADFDILVLESDTDAPGVFMLGRQRPHVQESTPRAALHSMITGRRTTQVTELQVWGFNLRHRFGPRIASIRRSSTRALRRRVLWPVWGLVPDRAQLGIKRILRRA